MNILFLLKTIDVGGVEVVTSVLANKFVQEGHSVTIFVLSKGDGGVLSLLSPYVGICFGSGINESKDNVQALRQILIDGQVDVVINQWVFPYAPIKTLSKARVGLNVKVISVYHNDPLSNGRIQGVEMEIARTSISVKKFLLNVKKRFFRKLTSRCMRYCYDHSDKFMVLSPSYIDNFKEFTGVKKPEHLIVQTNPVTIDTSSSYSLPKKEKEILFVGRLDNNQKRVFRVIETWTLLESEFPEWKLTLVGDGDDRPELESYVKSLGLKRVSFEGFKNPLEYYKRASILMLTSEYEGFGLVIVEGMTFGVVPVVYDSYKAVHDIITDGKDGFIVPRINGDFCSHEMADSMRKLMADEDMRTSMMRNTKKSAVRFSLNNVSKQWSDVFTDLVYSPVGGG